MVRNKLHWDANNAVGLPKQRNSYQSSPTFLCFEIPTASFAAQCNLFRTMWWHPAKGLLETVMQTRDAVVCSPIPQVFGWGYAHVEGHTGVFSWCVISWCYSPWNANLRNYSSQSVIWRFCVAREKLELLNRYLWSHHSSLFSVFGYPDETLSLVFDTSLEGLYYMYKPLTHNFLGCPCRPAHILRYLSDTRLYLKAKMKCRWHHWLLVVIGSVYYRSPHFPSQLGLSWTNIKINYVEIQWSPALRPSSFYRPLLFGRTKRYSMNLFWRSSHYSGTLWKRSFISTTVRPTVHPNSSWKRSFSRTLFKPEEFEIADFSYSCGQKTFWKQRWRHDSHVTTLTEFSFPPTQIQNVNGKHLIRCKSENVDFKFIWSSVDTAFTTHI